jgi:hypothetical protein
MDIDRMVRQIAVAAVWRRVSADPTRNQPPAHELQLPQREIFGRTPQTAIIIKFGSIELSPWNRELRIERQWQQVSFYQMLVKERFV